MNNLLLFTFREPQIALQETSTFLKKSQTSVSNQMSQTDQWKYFLIILIP